MNTATLFQHYRIIDNPFRAEEARHDAVFTRVEAACHHPDYQKIRGEFDRPSSAIVFGERGSGKTAIRMQIEDELREHNGAHSDRRCLGVSYDELNPILDRLHQHLALASADETLARMRLTDHIDGILVSVVPPLVDQILGEDTGTDRMLEEEAAPGKRLRTADETIKRDLLLLQVCYDRPEEADLRTARLRHAIRARSRSIMPWLKWSAAVLGVITLGLLMYVLFAEPEQRWLWLTGLVILALLTIGLGGRFIWHWWRVGRLARGLSRALRVLHRSPLSFRRSLSSLSVDDVLAGELPQTESDDQHYAMIKRLLRAVRPFGYRSMIVLFDRIDEPTLINGEPSRMRAVVWPMMNNKFLQQDNFGIKMLLPLDLKHLLYRETQDFFREARLDKQNLIDRLTWSGATLYDLCTARLNACREPDAEPMSLTDLFDDSVSHQDLVDALDQMQQPRDAFKLLYQVIQDHCAGVPEERPVWKMPKLTLDNVRKGQVDRLAGMLRGVRPG